MLRSLASIGLLFVSCTCGTAKVTEGEQSEPKPEFPLFSLTYKLESTTCFWASAEMYTREVYIGPVPHKEEGLDFDSLCAYFYTVVVDGNLTDLTFEGTMNVHYLIQCVSQDDVECDINYALTGTRI